MSDQGQPIPHPAFKIIRDEKYHRTLKKDLRQHAWRRKTRELAAWYETLFKVPGWLSVAARSGRKKQTLSTCIITMNSADRIRPLLEYIRQFSDEIVVGVDSKTSDNTFEACKGLVDELFMIENDAQTCNAGLEALVKRCHGDWVFRLDDDEFPEPDFIALKDGILAAGRYTHYKLPRLHLSSVGEGTDELFWINDSYLYPDYQMRLFRNDPSLIRYPEPVGHVSIGCDGPKGRLNTINLVHLNLAINPRFKREEKLNRYIERLNGGWVHPVNEHALLFEDFSYKTEPYRGGDEKFRALLAETVRHQRNLYSVERAGAR